MEEIEIEVPDWFVTRLMGEKNCFICLILWVSSSTTAETHVFV